MQDTLVSRPAADSRASDRWLRHRPLPSGSLTVADEYFGCFPALAQHHRMGDNGIGERCRQRRFMSVWRSGARLGRQARSELGEAGQVGIDRPV